MAMTYTAIFGFVLMGVLLGFMVRQLLHDLRVQRRQAAEDADIRLYKVAETIVLLRKLEKALVCGWHLIPDLDKMSNEQFAKERENSCSGRLDLQEITKRLWGLTFPMMDYPQIPSDRAILESSGARKALEDILIELDANSPQSDVVRFAWAEVWRRFRLFGD